MRLDDPATNAAHTPPPRSAPTSAVLAVAVILAAVLTTWRSGTYLELYYAAAVRSMSMSLHNFVFGSFDPVGTVTLDKLPGAFWVQAVSVRIFGLHTWSILLPQVIEGVLAVLVLFRVVRRLVGPEAAALAAMLLALSPSLVALDRGNISDSLMILLLVLAANAVVSAALTGRWRHLLLAGAWVGLAFQAKMIEAWIILPVLALLYLFATTGSWRRRGAAVMALGLSAVTVSLSWIVAVSLVPATSRPYVDGSHTDSLLQQVFVYNGFGRLDQFSPNQLLSRAIGLPIPLPPSPSWHRILTGSLGRDIGWLVPAALILGVTSLVVGRRAPRGDRARASTILWLSWLLLFGLTFSVSSSINAYYLAALAPPLAALVGSGSVLLWTNRHLPWSPRVAVGATAASVVYGAWLLPTTGTGLFPGLRVVLLALGILACGLLLASSVRPSASRALSLGLVCSLGAVTVVPSVAATSIAIERLGAFDTPFEPAVVATGIRDFFDITAQTAALVPGLRHYQDGAPFLMATETSALAAPFIYASGLEVLPIGGFTGTIPAPTLSALTARVHAGDFHLVLQSPTSHDPRLDWIAHHCLPAPAPKDQPRVVVHLAIFYCLRSS